MVCCRTFKRKEGINGRTKGHKTYLKNNKMEDLNSTLSVITLNLI
jgi:hypothetical protein